MIYIFEGADGTGKTTAIKRIMAELTALDAAVYSVKFNKPRTIIDAVNQRRSFRALAKNEYYAGTTILVDRTPEISGYIYGPYQSDSLAHPTRTPDDIPNSTYNSVLASLHNRHKITVVGFINTPFIDEITHDPVAKPLKSESDCYIADNNRSRIIEDYFNFMTELKQDVRVAQVNATVRLCLDTADINAVVDDIASSARIKRGWDKACGLELDNELRLGGTI